jgi:hypothetical protein
LSGVDERVEDRSEKSKKNHVAYYKSLTTVIDDIQREIQGEMEPAIIKHLNDRIEAINIDRNRIKKMFPEIKEDEWQDNSKYENPRNHSLKTFYKKYN